MSYSITFVGSNPEKFYINGTKVELKPHDRYCVDQIGFNSLYCGYCQQLKSTNKPETIGQVLNYVNVILIIRGGQNSNCDLLHLSIIVSLFMFMTGGVMQSVKYNFPPNFANAHLGISNSYHLSS